MFLVTNVTFCSMLTKFGSMPRFEASEAQGLFYGKFLSLFKCILQEFFAIGLAGGPYCIKDIVALAWYLWTKILPVSAVS